MEPEPTMEDAVLKESHKEPDIDYEKIDYSKLDAGKIPDQIAQSTHAFSGLLSDKQALVTANQDLNQSVSLLQSELESREEATTQEPDEPMTRKEAQDMVENALEKQEAKRQAELKTSAAKAKQGIENKSLAQLRAEYPKDGDKPAAAGLDADTVIREGGAWLMANKPTLYKACLDSDDPAKELYEESISRVPKFRNLVRSQHNATFLETIKAGNVPKGSAQGGSEPDEASVLMDLIENVSEDEIMKRIVDEAE